MYPHTKYRFAMDFKGEPYAKIQEKKSVGSSPKSILDSYLSMQLGWMKCGGSEHAEMWGH